MKGIARILALQLFLLAIVPCIDRDACEDEADGTTLIEAGIHNHLRSEQDNCSPFCISACCTPHFASHPIAIIDFFAGPTDVSILTPYADRFLPSRMQTIWQPPRLA